MQKIHKGLSKYYPWYKSWHENPTYAAAHWIALILVGFVMGSMLTSVISKTNFEVTFSTSLGNTSNNQSVSRTVVADKTTMLLKLAKAYQILLSNSQASDTALNQLVTVATDRAAALDKLLAQDPHSALLEAIPAALALQLPEEIRPLLEKHVEKTGTVTVYYEDYIDEGREVLVYSLDADETGPNNTYRMYFAQGEPDLKTGDRVKVAGMELNNKLVMAEVGGSSLQVSSSTQIAQLSGDQRTLAILFNFSDNTSQPFTASTVANSIFNNSESTNYYYQDSSLDAMSFSGVAVGWYTIPYTSGNCAYSTWSSAADSAAQSAGINLSTYPRRVYVFPSNGSCGWAGLGTVGGNPSRAWINGYTNSFVYSHELGHNLGMHHAASLLCGSKAIDNYANCTYSEYGDPFDVLGGSWTYRHNNGAHKTQLGWVNTRNVTASGTYTVNVLEDVAGYQALKIAKPDTSESYFVEYRQPSAFEYSLPSNMINGVSVVVHNGSSQTKKLDLIPDGNLNASALVDGGSFTDPVNGITISQISHDPTQATVQVTMAGPTCSQANPTLSLSPLSQSGNAGTQLNYSLSVRNNDSTACSSRNFPLSALVPSGWSSSFNNSSPTLSPGQSTSVTFSVTSAGTAADGSYPLAVQTSGASTQATYIVFTAQADTTAPVVTITSPKAGEVLKQKGKKSISATASDASGIAKIDLFVDGVLVRSCANATTCSYNWNLGTVSAGQHTISTTATDKSVNANTNSASLTVTK